MSLTSRRTVMCRIWYSISRTVSDDDAHRRRHDDRSDRAFAVKPRAYGAPQKRHWGLTARRGRAIPGDRAANALTTMLRLITYTAVGQCPTGRVLVFSCNGKEALQARRDRREAAPGRCSGLAG